MKHNKIGKTDVRRLSFYCTNHTEFIRKRIIHTHRLVLYAALKIRKASLRKTKAILNS